MIMQMNDPYSISNFFIVLFETYFIASKLWLYISESVTLLNCRCNVFWSCVAIIIAAAIKKDCSCRNNCGFRLHDGDLEHSLIKEKKKDIHMFLFPFLHSVIPDLDLRILKMLVRVCFRDVLQLTVY